MTKSAAFIVLLISLGVLSSGLSGALTVGAKLNTVAAERNALLESI